MTCDVLKSLVKDTLPCENGKTIKLHIPTEKTGFLIRATSALCAEFSYSGKEKRTSGTRVSVTRIKDVITLAILKVIDVTLFKVATCLLDNCVGKRVNLLQKHFFSSRKKKNRYRSDSFNCWERPRFYRGTVCPCQLGRQESSSRDSCSNSLEESLCSSRPVLSLTVKVSSRFK